MKSTLFLASSLSVLFAATGVKAQGLFTDVGSESWYWHNRYHGILTMAAYGDPNTTCRETFTTESLARNYPDSREPPFQYLGTFGPTPTYGVEGYMVKVPEMNKILFIVKDVIGWQNLNATLTPLLGVGCDSTCMAHADAINAWHEVKNATNDMQAIKDNQGNFVFSSAGHGFGGAIAQLGAMDLKHRGIAYSCMTFGAPAVFNAAGAAQYNQMFPSEDSQRCVSHDDAVPNMIPINNGDTVTNSSYAFVDTGVHVFGTNPMYGQDYRVCYSNEEEECHGGSNVNDHWFYYTDAGQCGQDSYTETFNVTFNQYYQNMTTNQYLATAAVSTIGTPVTSGYVAHTTSTTTTTPPATSTAVPTGVPSLADEAASSAGPTTATLVGRASTLAAPASAGLLLVGAIALLWV